MLIAALILAALSGVLSTQSATTVDLQNAEALYVAEGGADAVMSDAWTSPCESQPWHAAQQDSDEVAETDHVWTELASDLMFWRELELAALA